eukprot:3056712-Amphidinium_carterae.1
MSVNCQREHVLQDVVQWIWRDGSGDTHRDRGSKGVTSLPWSQTTSESRSQVTLTAMSSMWMIVVVDLCCGWGLHDKWCVDETRPQTDTKRLWTTKSKHSNPRVPDKLTPTAVTTAHNNRQIARNTAGVRGKIMCQNDGLKMQ